MKLLVATLLFCTRKFGIKRHTIATVGSLHSLFTLKYDESFQRFDVQEREL
jgi:hypothetical protein